MPRELRMQQQYSDRLSNILRSRAHYFVICSSLINYLYEGHCIVIISDFIASRLALSRFSFVYRVPVAQLHCRIFILFCLLFTGALNETQTELCNEMNFFAQTLYTRMLKRCDLNSCKPSKNFFHRYLRNYYRVSHTAELSSLPSHICSYICDIKLVLVCVPTFYINFSFIEYFS